MRVEGFSMPGYAASSASEKCSNWHGMPRGQNGSLPKPCRGRFKLAHEAQVRLVALPNLAEETLWSFTGDAGDDPGAPVTSVKIL